MTGYACWKVGSMEDLKKELEKILKEKGWVLTSYEMCGGPLTQLKNKEGNEVFFERLG